MIKNNDVLCWLLNAFSNLTYCFILFYFFLLINIDYSIDMEDVQFMINSIHSKAVLVIASSIVPYILNNNM